MSEMICTCGAEGVREVEARRLRILHRMGLDDMSDLMEAIVLSLGFDFQAEALIEADQWFGVSISTPLVEKGLYIECDDPADGLAALWEELAEKFPERVSVKQNTSDAGVRVTERLSKALLLNYEIAEMDYRSHRTAAHKDDNYYPRCEDCSVFMALSITAHIVLGERWGSRTVEKAVEKSFEGWRA